MEVLLYSNPKTIWASRFITLSLGFDIETGGMYFSCFLQTLGMTEKQFIGATTGQWKKEISILDLIFQGIHMKSHRKLQTLKYVFCLLIKSILMKRLFYWCLFEYSFCSQCTEIHYQKWLYRFLFHTSMRILKEIITGGWSTWYFDRGIGFPGTDQSFHLTGLLWRTFQRELYGVDKIPKSVFKGRSQLSAVDFSKSGTYDITVEGDLHHDVTKRSAQKNYWSCKWCINANSKFK